MCCPTNRSIANPQFHQHFKVPQKQSEIIIKEILTDNVHEAVSDPAVHPAVDDGVEASVGDGQDVDCREDVGESHRLHGGGEHQAQYLDI